MPIYPIYPCCYCPVVDPEDPCSNTKKVSCDRFLSYIEKLNRFKSHSVLIKELKDLITTKGGK
jgi:hypothetical protein